MRRAEVVAALDAEVAVAAPVLSGISAAAARRSTRCSPWGVLALAVHTAGALVRVCDALDGPRPPAARVSVLGYFRPDARFSPEVDARRISDAAEAADHADPGEPGRALERTWRDLRPRVEAEPRGSVVRTRHGDAMALEDFLLTRVVELVVHGLDLADALEHEAWTAPPALEAVADLLLPAGTGGLEMSTLEAVRAATGRALPSGPGPDALENAGVCFPALG
ncbi:mycothiol maleylpyruvate isomerase [Streptomonospora alba]|uniref:Mycothiol maleylpyruvate isomerase n=1 Tax=Streptomonospora alba TaxID=183763 RepID=A0A0C2JPQ5_9ACTN|nr:maleylpyruvate isomerase N-terminal domain-containing protein [Streptomonospora alba]KIH98792.1 mycothiol maleylpyruvate isomerase [Streptomonospora alba]